jgi:hypothetical protein
MLQYLFLTIETNMSVRNSNDKTFSMVSASDTIDASHSPEGMGAMLTNLIPANGTQNLWVPRPAATRLTDFTGFTTPGFVSALLIVGDVVYGMIATGRNVGKDEPFAYNILTGTFIAISGVTNANSPTSPPTSGTWTPPTMDTIGPYIVITHPGFNGLGTNFFGVIDITNPAAPVWSSQNTTTVPLPAVPTAVMNFNGRAYFAVNEATYFTDVLTLNISTAFQVITYEDKVPVTALHGLGLSNQVVGGILQAMIVFKGLGHNYQVTGDSALGTLSRNSMNYAVGTLAPLGLCDTPYGTAVFAPDGLRIIGFDGKYSDPLGANGDGIASPFINALVPSRISASCNASVLRVGVQNASLSGQPYQDWWYHFPKKRWSGPHTFAPSLVQPYQTKFVFTPVSNPGELWVQETIPSTTSVYTENGAQLQCTWTTSFLPDDGRVGQFAIGETFIKMALDPNMNNWVASALNGDTAQYDAVSNTIPGTTSVWDSSVWDSAIWDGLSTGLFFRQIIWDTPIVSSRIQFKITFGAAAGVAIGDLKYTAESLGYVPQTGN